MKKNKHILNLIGSLAFFVSAKDPQAKIFLDHEKDPIPLFEITLYTSKGIEILDASHKEVTSLINHFLMIGPEGKTKEEFYGELADFGATYDAGAMNLGSKITLSFPFDPNRDYTKLIELVSAAWNTPRFSEKELKLAKINMNAGLKGVLDSDFSLNSQFVSRWARQNFLGIPQMEPALLEKVSLGAVKAHFENYILNVPDVWVGFVGPEAAVGLAEKFSTRLFPKSGPVEKTKLKKELPGEHQYSANKNLLKKKVFFVIDKPGQNQAVSQFLAISDKKMTVSDELNFWFGRHVLIDSGLGSYFGDELRNKRGLAYAVQGPQSVFFDRLSLNVLFNPQRVRQNEALEVFSQTLKTGFATGGALRDLPKADWERQFKSFKFSRILARSNPRGRLAERMSVVSGDTSQEFVDSKPERWKVDRGDIANFFSSLWNDSLQIVCVVGDLKEIKPLHEKFFSEYEFRSIPYKQALEVKSLAQGVFR